LQLVFPLLVDLLVYNIKLPNHLLNHQALKVKFA
jgi:hypothetical protein